MECMRLQTRCAYHLTEENRREKSTSEAIRHAVEVGREADLARVCIRHELESDEFSTRFEKAARILQTSRAV